MPAISFLSTALLAGLLTPLVIWWYRRHGWVDDPQVVKHAKVTHRRAVPRGGGLVIFFSCLIASLWLLHLDRYLVSILLGAGLLTVVGFWDDVADIHPVIRLVAGVAAAAIVVSSGIGIAYVSNPFGPGVIHLDQPQITWHWAGESGTIWVLADIFAILFIVWNMNIVNWSKGVDGQMAGFVSVSSVIIGLLAARFLDDPTQFNVTQLCFIVAGAFAGFLVWNWYPQKIIPGYGAGSLAGYFLSVTAILGGAKVATMLMVLAIPTADAIFTITRRILAGKSPLWGDRGHMHHKLLDVYGWGRRRIAFFYWLTSLGLGLLSLWLPTWGKITVMLATMSAVFVFLIWTKYKVKHGL